MSVLPPPPCAAPGLIAAATRLARALEEVTIGPPAAYVYNPLVYAREPYEAYLSRYGGAPKEVVLLGMNPGPFGMAQTGVPFGEVAFVRDWLGISGRVDRPPREHPRRPVEGFACRRSEVSGRRLWGWIRSTFGEPQRFFARFFVANYCPLLFIDEAGRNVTPDRLAAADRRRLFAACDAALVETVAALRPRLVVGIGRFAEGRARGGPRRDRGGRRPRDPSQPGKPRRQSRLGAARGPGTRGRRRRPAVTVTSSGTLAAAPSPAETAPMLEEDCA